MSIPASYSDRPLWITLAIDVALTPVGVFASAWLLRINDPWQAIYTGVLGTGIVVGAGVVVVGVASVVRELIVTGKTRDGVEQMAQTETAEYTPPRPTPSLRVTSKEWRHPTPVPTPSIPDQYVAEADEEIEAAAPEEEEALIH